MNDPLMTDPASTGDVIRRALSEAPGPRVLDIGCGDGALAGLIIKLGAQWTGVDPAPPADAPPEIRHAPAEALPFADASFDMAVFLNALHHVPEAAMDTALAEAMRVLRREGRLVVVEPLATGPLSQVLAVVDDESRIRAAAQASIARQIERGLCLLIGAFDYAREEHYRDFDDFATRIARVDAGRAAAIERRRAALESAFARHAAEGPDGMLLHQPMQAHILAPG